MDTLKSLTAVWLLIANDLGANPKTLETFERRSLNEGLEFVTVTMPALGKELTLALSVGYLTVASRFKLKRNTNLPVFLHEYFTEIFDADGYIQENPNIAKIQELRQLLLMLGKFVMPFTPEMEEKAYMAFYETDDSVKTGDWPQSLDAVLQHFQTLLPDDPKDIRMHHASGATADSISNSEKRGKRRFIPSLNRVYGWNYFFNTESHVNNWLLDNQVEISEPSAKFILVPKDSTKPRGISAEPHERMFAQKGLQASIYDFIETVSPAKGYINFTDQRINQNLARQGSLDHGIATIDLKDASDLVSWALIRRLCPLKWVAALSATRTTVVTTPIGEVELNKFAPMGSALCFPIEAMLFWSICRTVTSEVWVYGDDIVVARECAQDVMSALESYGLVINHSKSLTTGSFRESCGGEYYRGQDVSVTRLKSLSRVNYIPFCNLITDRYGEKTSHKLIQHIENDCVGPVMRGPIHESGEPEALVYYSSYTSSASVFFKMRYNAALQRHELRSPAVVTRNTPDENLSDYDLLFDWLTRSERKTSPEKSAILRDLEREFGEAMPPRARSVLIGLKSSGSINSWSRNTKIKFRWGPRYGISSNSPLAIEGAHDVSIADEG